MAAAPAANLRCVPWFRSCASEAILKAGPKRIVLSGPSGFLGNRVLASIVEVQQYRKEHGLEPGEVILLSSSPGRLMEFITNSFGFSCMKNIRASRVDYFTQHEPAEWIDQLGALNAHGSDAVFINLAAISGPVRKQPAAMAAVNYHATVAAANACNSLGFGHFIQSSTQATQTERAGQVPYSKHKSMADFALSHFSNMPVSVLLLGLLYCRKDGSVGQRAYRDGNDHRGRPIAAKLNLIDLSLLPLTPIMGNGKAPLQPQEVEDAASRICFLAMTDPKERPVQETHVAELSYKLEMANPSLRIYDAVGPETISMLELLQRFAHYQGKENFRPVYIDYRNMEELINVRSLGNLNRQFISLLRSEQDGVLLPQLGNPDTWNALIDPMGEGKHKLMTLDEIFQERPERQVRTYPYWKTLNHIWENPRVIRPGINLSVEIIRSFLSGRKPDDMKPV